MLISLLNLIFNILYWVLNLVSWALLIYVIMSMVLPRNKYTLLIGKYIEPLLSPVRGWLRRVFPKLFDFGMDVSPIGLWLLITVAGWLLQLLQRILL